MQRWVEETLGVVAALMASNNWALPIAGKATLLFRSHVVYAQPIAVLVLGAHHTHTPSWTF